MKKKITIYGALCLLATLGLVSSGCSHSPTLDVAGSFFPSWMICLAVGITISGGLRAFLQPRKLDAGIGPLVVFYPAVALLLSCLLWLLLFS